VKPTALLAITLTAALLAGCTQPGPPTPLDRLTPNQLAGHDIFQSNCARCHNDRTPDYARARSLLGLYRRSSFLSGPPATDDRVLDVIHHGGGIMPAFAGRLTPQQQQQILAYLHTL
jgi:mono/diheme cytochrome c family protein